MGLTDSAVVALAQELYEAERDVRAVAPPSERYPKISVEDAYAIQRHGRGLREAGGARVVGRKVGLTSVAMQELLGVDEPDFGYLTNRMLHEDGTVISTSGLVAPRVEAEIAFRLAVPLHGAGVDREAALAAIGEIAPSLEVVDSRIADWRITLPDTVADNASSRHAVLGSFVPIGDTDLTAVAMTMVVEHGDGSTESMSGEGAAVLGHPAEALAWLVRALAPFGEGVDAGEVVIPGAMARAVTITSAGARVAADFGALGRVAAKFARAVSP